jgi:hypothetical protein
MFVVVMYATPFYKLMTEARGFYAPMLKVITCNHTPSSCWHEIGHVIDVRMNNVSKTPEFGAAVQLYLFYQIKYTDNTQAMEIVFNAPGIITYSEHFQPFHLEAFSSPQQELYADIFSVAGGDLNKIDPALRKFYLDGKDYQTLYERLMTEKYVFLEGE